MINGSYAYDWLYLRKELIGRGLSQLIPSLPIMSMQKYAEIGHELGLRSGQCRLNLRKILQVRKSRGRWIPHQLTEEQKTSRLEFCHAMLARFDKPPKFQRSRDIVTGMRPGDTTMIQGHGGCRWNGSGKDNND